MIDPQVRDVLQVGNTFCGEEAPQLIVSAKDIPFREIFLFDSVFLFDLSEPEIFIQSYLMTGTDSPISGNGELSPLSVSGKRVRAVPKKLADRFGSDFYSHRLTSSSPELQSEDAWKLWLEGQLFETGEKLQVTKFDEMQRFIAEQLAPIKQKEEVDFNA